MDAKLKQSINRCLADREFANDFYTYLFSEHPELMSFFKHADHNNLVKMLSTALTRINAIDKLSDENFEYWMRVSGKHHSLKLTNTHYDKWKTALIKHVAIKDSEADPDTLLAWDHHIEQYISYMKLLYTT